MPLRALRKTEPLDQTRKQYRPLSSMQSVSLTYQDFLFA
jgi:hypothetical protein